MIAKGRLGLDKDALLEAANGLVDSPKVLIEKTEVTPSSFAGEKDDGPQHPSGIEKGEGLQT